MLTAEPEDINHVAVVVDLGNDYTWVLISLGLGSQAAVGSVYFDGLAC